MSATYEMGACTRSLPGRIGGDKKNVDDDDDGGVSKASANWFMNQHSFTHTHSLAHFHFALFLKMKTGQKKKCVRFMRGINHQHPSKHATTTIYCVHCAFFSFSLYLFSPAFVIMLGHKTTLRHRWWGWRWRRLVVCGLCRCHGRIAVINTTLYFHL